MTVLVIKDDKVIKLSQEEVDVLTPLLEYVLKDSLEGRTVTEEEGCALETLLEGLGAEGHEFT